MARASMVGGLSTGERFDARQFTGASNHFPLVPCRRAAR
jgi:hypothetical protein